MANGSFQSSEGLAIQVSEARERTLQLVCDLEDARLQVPYLPEVNPLLWELCHTAYFQEYWVLRKGLQLAPLNPDCDALFDSVSIAHENRWRLPLPPRDEAVAYAKSVRDRVLEALAQYDELPPKLAYVVRYSLYHEDMHGEALWMTRQLLGYPPPADLWNASEAPADGEHREEDVEVPGGCWSIGAPRDVEFCFDNEKWQHDVDLTEFAIAKTAVTERQFAEFVADSGYSREELWTPAGWSWRQGVGAERPLFWRQSDVGLERRRFNDWVPVDSRRAMVHVSWFEADAFCRWAGRRLPSEIEWERAAASDEAWRDAGGRAANLDARECGPVDVKQCAAGDSSVKCRQMFGNVWEWTHSTFHPYKAFVPDMYDQYSQSSFETRKVLRGGSWVTRARLLRPTFRNFYQLGRRDVFAGFRTCAMD